MNEAMMIDINQLPGERAAELHGKVLAARDQVSDALCTFAMYLKAMRDDRLYIELGYDDFDSYVEVGVNINKRQVYNYISTYEKLGSTVLQSNAQLGITKLQLLAQVPDIERPEFMESNDLEGMSVSEIKELIKKTKEQSEQISLLKNELDDISSDRERFLCELNDIRSQPIDVAVTEPTDEQLTAIRGEIETELKSKQDKVLKKEQKQLRQEYETKIANIEEKYRTDMQRLRDEMSAAQSMAEQDPKLAEIATDADMITANFYIESISDNYNKLLELVRSIKNNDTEKSKLLILALSRMLEIVKDSLDSVDL